MLVGSDSGTSASPAAPMALVSAADGALFMSVGNINIRRLPMRLPMLVGKKENKENMTEMVPAAWPTRRSLGVCNARLDPGGTRRGLAMLASVCARAVNWATRVLTRSTTQPFFFAFGEKVAGNEAIICLLPGVAFGEVLLMQASNERQGAFRCIHSPRLAKKNDGNPPRMSGFLPH